MGDTYTSCIYNEVEPAQSGRVLRLYDTTLRDGEQTRGVVFNRYQKLEIAQRLEEAGVPRIECGMPVSSSEDAKAAGLIVNNIKNSEVFALCRCTRSDIDCCLDLGIRNVMCELPISELKMNAYGLTRQVVRERMLNAIGHAKSQGMHVIFFGVDATRAEPDFLQEIYASAVNDAHADEVVLVDTLGIATPQAMRKMVKLLKERISVPIGVHCHDDLNHGAACTLAAVLEGAHEAHVTVNGLGERTGNVDIAALAVAAKVLYGIESTVEYSKFCELSRCVEKYSGIRVSSNKPVVGSDIFVRESGLVVSQMLESAPAVEPYDPAMVGAQRGVGLGKNSGAASIQYTLQKYNLSLSESGQKKALAMVKALGIEKETSVTEDEFLQIVKQCGEQ